MAEGLLAATRRHLDGTISEIPLQGPAAASRMAEVGLAPVVHVSGGIWKFGLGVDQRAVRTWHIALQDAQAAGDAATINHLLKHPPTQRGYWLEEAATTGATPAKSGLGPYTARLHDCA